MPPQWGDRYFHAQASDDRNETPPEPRKPRFHHVFGTRPHRRYDAARRPRPEHSHDRARHAKRGRGQWRTFYPRTNGGRGGRPGRGGTPRINENEQQNDALLNTGDIDDVRLANPRFSRGAHEDREGSQRLAAAAAASLTETPPDSVFSASNPGVDQGRLKTAGRRKRVVPGGLIPKMERIVEYQGTLHCHICNESFRDINAKALHDRSFQHRRQFGYVRKEQASKKDSDAEDIVDLGGDTEEKRQKRLDQGIALFQRLGNNAVHPGFKDWAERSLQAGRKASDEAGDESIMQAVRLEVIDVYEVNEKNCTMRRTCWTRREPATGLAYRRSTDKPEALPIIPDCDADVKEKIEDLQDDPHLDELKEEDAKDENEPQQKNDGAVHPDSVNYIPALMSGYVQQDEDLSTRAQSFREGFPADSPNATKKSSLSASRKPYLPVPLKWVRSNAAERLLGKCQAQYPVAILENYRATFEPKPGKETEPPKDREDPQSIKRLMEKYHALRKDFESEEYEYEDLKEGLSSLADELKERSAGNNERQKMYQMQIAVALQVGEYPDCLRPCTELVQMYRACPKSGQEPDFHFVGHWLLSLFFKRSVQDNRKRIPPALQMAQEMRLFPQGALADIWVYEAVQAMKAVLWNNWTSFFGRSMTSIVHSQPSTTSREILEGFVPYMRERALVTMMHMRLFESQVAQENGPIYLPLENLVVMLFGCDMQDDTEAKLAARSEAREFIEALPQPVVISEETDTTLIAQWDAHDGKGPAVSENSNVMDEMLQSMSKPRIIEDD